MSELKPFRTKHIAVSPRVFDALKVVAELEGHDCPDAVADLHLGLWLSTEYDLDWLSGKMKKAREDVSESYKDRLRAKKAPEVLPPAAKLPWNEVVCHVGANAKGKTLGAIFSPEKDEKTIAAIVGFFKDVEAKASHYPPEDQEKLPELLQAAKEGYEAWKAAKQAVATQTAPEAPQQPLTVEDWREFLIESKDSKLNGRKLGDLTPAEMNAQGAYLSKIDKKNETIYQKKLAVMYALATGESKVELPKYTRDLDAALKKSSISHETFVDEMHKAGLLHESFTTVASINQKDAEHFLQNWKDVEEACDNIPT